MADILDMLEEVEWTNPQKGRAPEPSPYLAAVQKSIGDGFNPQTKFGKSFAFTINVGKGSPETQDKELGKHVNLLRKAGRQTDPVCSVLVQAGEVNRKSGDVRIQFVTREKITRQGSATEASAA